MNPPKQTLYVNNLPDKPKKEELKRNLYYLFSQYGPVVDIVAMKTPRTRGQAFVVYKDLVHATAALRELQGFEFMDRKFNIGFAKAKSDHIAKMDGTFRNRDAKQRAKDRQQKERDFLARKGRAVARQPEGTKSVVLKRTREPEEKSRDHPEKRAKIDVGEVNSTLYLEDFPQSLTKQQDTLKVIFAPFSGLKDIRIPPPTGTEVASAFIEYETEAQATAAMKGLEGFPVTTNYTIHLKYAKK